MNYILEYSSFKLSPDDKVLIHYWYDGMITPVKILERKGRKYLVTHNIEDSKIQNAPDEWLKKEDIIDKYKVMESKLDDDFDKLDIDGISNQMFKYFIQDLKYEGKDNIVSEIKYRLSDGEEIDIVLKDVVDKLEDDTQAKFFGQRATAEIIFKKQDDKLDQKTLNLFAELRISIISKGIVKTLINMVTDQSYEDTLIVLKPYLIQLKEYLEEKQKVSRWLGGDDAPSNKMIIDEINKVI